MVDGIGAKSICDIVLPVEIPFKINPEILIFGRGIFKNILIFFNIRRY